MALLERGNGPHGQHPFMDVNGTPQTPRPSERPEQYAAHPMRPLTMPLAGLLVTAVLAGCGGSDDKQTTTAGADDQRGILATIDALQTASHAGDGAKVCSTVFTKSLVHSIEQASTRGCATEVREKLFRPEGSISVSRDITVTGDAATAVIREQNGNVSTLHLVRQSGTWRIDRVTPSR